MPITETVVDIVHDGQAAASWPLKELMSRSAKPEAALSDRPSRDRQPSRGR